MSDSIISIVIRPNSNGATAAVEFDHKMTMEQYGSALIVLLKAVVEFASFINEQGIERDLYKNMDAKKFMSEDFLDHDLIKNRKADSIMHMALELVLAGFSHPQQTEEFQKWQKEAMFVHILQFCYAFLDTIMTDQMNLAMSMKVDESKEHKHDCANCGVMLHCPLPDAVTYRDQHGMDTVVLDDKDPDAGIMSIMKLLGL